MRSAFRLYVLCCVFIGHSAIAQVIPPEQVGLSSERLSKIGPALQAYVDRKEVSGVVTMVARRGKVIYCDARGMRDIDEMAPMQQDTICRIYSMSKPVTSVAIMMLHEARKLDIDDPVSKYLPDLANLPVFVKLNGEAVDVEPARREMTIRDLLRHTSGLTYGLFGNTPVDQQYTKAAVLAPTGTLADMTHKLSRLPLLYHPGTRFNYSVSTDVLGRIVEVASEQSLDQFFAERIFKPLGMIDTGFHVPEEKFQRFAANYGPNPGGGLRVIDSPVTSAFRTPPKLLSGGGGLVSTAPDYMRFCLMLLGRGELGGSRILRPDSVAMMTKNQLPPEAYPIQVAGIPRQGVGFGLGFSVIVEKIALAPYVPIGEFGWGGAASTHFWISPGDELAVVVLTQYMPFSLRLESAVKPLVYAAKVAN